MSILVGGLLLFFLAFLALVIVLIVVGFAQAKKRRESLSAFAAVRGWTYRDADPTLVNRFSGRPFDTGDGRRATNCLYGQHEGRHVVAFDYQYSSTSGTGDSRSTDTSHFSVVAMSLGVAMPPLSVSPQGAIGRFFTKLTGSDIELGHEQFDRAFRVSSSDPRFAADVLHPQMVQMLLQWPALGWRFDGDSLLVIRPGQHDTTEVDATLAVMDAIIDQVPAPVWSTLRGDH